MTDEMKKYKAQQAFDTLCASLDKDNWKYGKKEEEFIVYYNETGDDLTMQCLIMVDAERQVIRFLSTLPVQLSDDKLIEGAVACCIVNSQVAYGSFDLAIPDGRLTYRMTYSFKDSIMGKDFYREMRCFATTVLDKYNDKFVALAEGRLRATDFLNM